MVSSLLTAPSGSSEAAPSVESIDRSQAIEIHLQAARMWFASGARSICMHNVYMMKGDDETNAKNLGTLPDDVLIKGATNLSRKPIDVDSVASDELS